MASGPLSGVRVLELGGLGPAPFAGMMIADMGADVIRVDRRVAPAVDASELVLLRGRRSIVVDLKSGTGVDLLLRLVEDADVLLEPFRPGVAERLGLGPEVCLQRNPRLVYGRMTGWGQSGPYALMSGHDINYIALSGVLAHLGREGGPPTPPLNIVGDFGGGGMLMAFGIVSALLEAGRSGRGQVVDAAMIDGSALQMALVHGLYSRGRFDETARGANILDSGAPYYDVYECADGEYISLGAIEPQFYDRLVATLGLTDLPSREEPANWPLIRDRFAERFRSRTQAQWSEDLEAADVCFAPVLRMSQAPQHPHHRARGTFLTDDDVLQAAPAPRFSVTPGAVQCPAPQPGAHTDEVLGDLLGLDEVTLKALGDSGVIGR